MLYLKISRNFSGSSRLKAVLEKQIEQKRLELQDIIQQHGDKVMGDITLNQVVGGMRGIKGLFFDQSTVDPNEGVLFRGLSIPEIHKKLPKTNPVIPKTLQNHSNEISQKSTTQQVLRQPMPEGIFYLLLTGQVPSDTDVELVRSEWESRGELSKQTHQFIEKLDTDLHAMTMLNLVILFEQKNSIFAAEQAKVVTNNLQYDRLWESTYEDSVDILAKLPSIVAAIYHRKFKRMLNIQQDSASVERNTTRSGMLTHNEVSLGATKTNTKGLDWAGRLSTLLGFPNDDTFSEGLRAFLTLHSDHEGGEVSTHASHLAASALADPYLCISNSYAGLAGPLHGLANQEVLKWVLSFVEKHGFDVPDSVISDHVDFTFQSGKLVPGYGHAVLRKIDPRFTHFRDFSAARMSDRQMVKLLLQMTTVIPAKLRTFKKISNPYPNIDAASGTLLYEIGLKNYTFYTVLFAMSRSIGCLSNLVWGRALNLPIERPRSISMNDIKKGI